MTSSSYQKLKSKNHLNTTVGFKQNTNNLWVDNEPQRSASRVFHNYHDSNVRNSSVHSGASNNGDFERSSTKNNPGDSNQNSAVKRKPPVRMNFETKVTKDDLRSWNGDSPLPKEAEREKSVYKNSGVGSPTTDRIKNSRNIVGLKNLKDKGYYVNSEFGNFDKIRPMTMAGASQSIIQIYKNEIPKPLEVPKVDEPQRTFLKSYDHELATPYQAPQASNKSPNPRFDVYNNGLKYLNTSTPSLSLQKTAQVVNQKAKKMGIGRPPAHP